MAAGLPVLATDVGELKDLVEKFQVGLTVSYDSAAFAKAVIELKENPDKLALYQSHGQAESASFDWHILMLKYLEIIENLISKK